MMTNEVVVATPRPGSRPGRWRDAVLKMRIALDSLIELRDEYQEWLDNMPENAQEGATADKLRAICEEIDFDSIDTTIDEIENAELPKGFGRD